jgi:hypothetical protein
MLNDPPPEPILRAHHCQVTHGDVVNAVSEDSRDSVGRMLIESCP